VNNQYAYIADLWRRTYPIPVMIQINKMVLCDYRSIQYWQFIVHIDIIPTELIYNENGSPILRGKFKTKKDEPEGE
jgi:hypothetical protein